ncbi:MAG: hypothetical protein WBG43_10890 [Marinifilaceae bacterium]
MYKIVIVGLLVLSSLNVFSQEISFTKNIKIESQYKTVLPKVNKLDYNPVIRDTIFPRSSFDYVLKTKRASSFYDLVENEFPKYSEEKEAELDGGYLKLAAGNHLRVLGEFAYNNTGSKKFNWGMYLRSNTTSGKVYDRESGYVDQTALLYFMKIEKYESYGATISYDNNLLHLYDINKDKTAVPVLDIERSRRGELAADFFYNKITYSGTRYGAKLNYTNFSDTKMDVSENLVDLDLHTRMELGNNILLLNLGVDLLKSASNYTAVSFEPHFKTDLWKFKFDFGMGVSQYMGDDSKFYFYPKSSMYIDVLGKTLGLYAEANGGVKDNNYLKSYKVNPYALVGESVPTYTKYSFSGGFKGRFDNLFWYNIGAKYADINNYMYYGVDSKKKNLVQNYTDVHLLSFMGVFGVNFDENLSLLTTFKSYAFDVDKFDDNSLNEKVHILNVPSFELTLNAKYEFSEKLSCSADLFVLGKRKTSEMLVNTNESITNKMILDMNLNVEYKFSKHIQAFANGNNMFNQHYQRWEEYPVMGIGGLLGLSITF